MKVKALKIFNIISTMSKQVVIFFFKFIFKATVN